VQDYSGSFSVRRFWQILIQSYGRLFILFTAVPWWAPACSAP